MAFSLARFRLSRDEERVLFLTVAGLGRLELITATNLSTDQIDACWDSILVKTQAKTVEDAIARVVGPEATAVAGERVRQTDALKRRLAAMREAELLQGIGSIEIDRNSILGISDGAKAILGIEETGMPLGEGLEAFVHADDQAKLRRAVTTMVRAGHRFDVTLRFVLKTGLKTLRVQGHPLRDSAEHFALVVQERGLDLTVVQKDGTTFGLEAIAASLPDLVYIYDLKEGRNVYANESVDEVLGYSAEMLAEMGSRLLEMIVHPEDLPGVLAKGRERMTMEDGAIQDLEYRIRHGRGHWIHASTRTKIFARDEDGVPSQIIGILQDITSRKEAEEKLRRSEDMIRRTLEDAPQGVAVLRLDGGFQRVNPAFCQIFGFTAQELIGGSWARVTGGETLEKFVDWLATEQESKSGVTHRYETGVTTASGSEIIVNVVASVVRDSDGNPLHIIAQVRDVTEARQSAERIREAHQRFEATLEALQDGVVFLDENLKFVIVNRKAAELVGTAPENLLGARLEGSPWALYDVDGREMAFERRPIVRALKGEVVTGEEYQIRHSDGELRWIRFNCAPLYREGRTSPYAAVSSFLDISLEREQRGSLRQNLLQIQELNSQLERRALELEAHDAELEEKNQVLNELAGTDSLTGLRNRRRGFDYLAARVSEYERYGRPLTIAMVDIDHFKVLNDTYGHLEGDRVLVDVSRLMTQTLRASDFVVRYGGEEFLVVMPETKLSDGLVVAERLRETVKAGTKEDRPLTVSVGVVSMSLEISKAEDLICRADQALYASKASGRNLVSFYDHNAEEVFSLASAT